MVMTVLFIFACSSTYKPIIKHVVLPDVTDLHYRRRIACGLDAKRIGSASGNSKSCSTRRYMVVVSCLSALSINSKLYSLN